MVDGNGQDMVIAEMKEIDGARSVQSRYNPPFDEGFTSIVMRFAMAGQFMPQWGDPMRDVEMHKFFYALGNDLVQGAGSTLVKKVNALTYTITGPERQIGRQQLLLNRYIEMGRGWLRFLPRFVLSYLIHDRGAMAEVVRNGAGQIVSIANLDPLRCTACDDPDFPIIYLDADGVYHKLADADVMHIMDMPSTTEGDPTSNIGLCALSRVLKSARIIQMLSVYKDEKLSSRPVPGLLLAKGLTTKQLTEALKEADEKEVSERGRLLYRNIPIIASMSSDYEAGLEMVEFRSIPDAMNLTDEVTLFVHTLALAFGLDVRDLGWASTQTGDTKADAAVQAQKARGKGMGEIIQQIEFQLNTKVMPASCEFKFDFQDDEEDRMQTEIRTMRVNLVRSMWEPSPVTMGGLISDGEARNLLVDDGILPEEFRIEDLTPMQTITPNQPETPEVDEEPLETEGMMEEVGGE